jgi:hypothetical protein
MKSEDRQTFSWMACHTGIIPVPPAPHEREDSQADETGRQTTEPWMNARV